MSQFDDRMAAFSKMVADGNLGVDEGLLKAIAKSLGPSLYNDDASRIACSDKDEKLRIKQNFLIKKLGMTDGPELDKAVDAVCEQMGSSNRNKQRAVFYALLVKHFGKESMYV